MSMWTEVFFFFKQKTAYEMRISDWSSDVCSSDLLLALYIACAEKQGASRRELTGTVQNDIVKEYLSRGTYIFPPQPSLRLITDVIAFAYREVPQWNPTNVCSYHLQEAGATPVQELAFALATAVSVLDSLRDRKSTRSDEHTSELQSLMRFPYAVLCLQQ